MLDNSRGWTEASEVAERASRTLLEAESRRGGTRLEPTEGNPVRSPEELADDHAAFGLQHAPDLAQNGQLIGDLAESGHHVRAIEAVVEVRQGLRVTLGRKDVRDRRMV
jgi:hypothetical protein